MSKGFLSSFESKRISCRHVPPSHPGPASGPPHSKPPPPPPFSTSFPPSHFSRRTDHRSAGASRPNLACLLTLPPRGLSRGQSRGSIPAPCLHSWNPSRPTSGHKGRPSSRRRIFHPPKTDPSFPTPRGGGVLGVRASKTPALPYQGRGYGHALIQFCVLSRLRHHSALLLIFHHSSDLPL